MEITPSLIVNGSLDPIPGGQRHEVTVDLIGSFPWSGNTFVFGLQATDDAGLRSGLSNLLVVTFDPVTFPQNTGDPVVQEADSGSELPTATPPQTGNTATVVGAVVGGMLGIALIGVVIVGFAAKTAARKRESTMTVVVILPDALRVDVPREIFVPPIHHENPQFRI